MAVAEFSELVSTCFWLVKSEAQAEIDGEMLYVVKGDTLGGEDELFVEAVIRGAVGQGQLNREVFEELDESDRELILNRFRS